MCGKIQNLNFNFGFLAIVVSVMALSGIFRRRKKSVEETPVIMCVALIFIS